MPGRIIADVLGWVEVGLIVVASVVAKYAYIGVILGQTTQTEPYLLAGFACAVLFRHFQRDRGINEPEVSQQGAQWRSMLGSLLLALLTLIATAYAFKLSTIFSRGWVTIWFLLASAVLVVERTFLRHLLAKTGGLERRVAIASDGGPMQNLLQAIEGDPRTRLVGSFKIDPVGIAKHETDPTNSVAPFADLIKAAKQEGIDELIIRVSKLTCAQLSFVIEEMSVLPVDIWLSTSDEALDLPIYGFGRAGGVNLVKVRERPIGGWGLIVKQLIDYTFAGIGLLVLLPAFLLISVAIKLDSSGAVFFRQRRLGCNEREIIVFKFRTMTVAEDNNDVVQAKKGDPRVTRVGRLLRMSSFDELPQLINVLRGEMSLVGPRPHALVHNEYYRSRVNRYSNRHKVKPGITGLAQINGLRGLTDTPEKMRQRVEMDIQYINNWSIWLDLKILALTPIFGLTHRNAY
jgi:putative colanic acid biosynthesis UDP-glucose lipid carrier transferase